MNKAFMWLLRLLPAAILLQTLYFKFTAHPESVYIFSTLGVEPWGRLVTGCLELVAAACLLIPRTVVYGAVAGVGLMSGAILSHAFFLGVEVHNDGGLLFTYACIVFLSCAILIFKHRHQLPVYLLKLNADR